MWHSCAIFVLGCDLVIVASTESYRTTHQSQPATGRCDECSILYQACRYWFLCGSVLPELYIYLLPTGNDGPCDCSCFCSSPGPHPANSGASKMTTNVGFWLHSPRISWCGTLPTFRRTADWRITDTGVSR